MRAKPVIRSKNHQPTVSSVVALLNGGIAKALAMPLKTPKQLCEDYIESLKDVKGISNVHYDEKTGCVYGTIQVPKALMAPIPMISCHYVIRHDSVSVVNEEDLGI